MNAATDTDKRNPVRVNDSAGNRNAGIIAEGLNGENNAEIDRLERKNSQFKSKDHLDKLFILADIQHVPTGSQTLNEIVGLENPDFDISDYVDPALNVALGSEVAIVTTIQQGQIPSRNLESLFVMANNQSPLSDYDHQSNVQEVDCMQWVSDIELHQLEEAPPLLSGTLRKDASNESEEGTLRKKKKVFMNGEKGRAPDVKNSSSSREDTLRIGKRNRESSLFPSYPLEGQTHACRECNKQFNLQRNLTRHLRIHTDERPHKCEVCNQSFNRKDTLSSHSRTHTGEKPYKCDVCNKSFKQRGNLSKHSMIHTGEKPFSCEVCNVSFNRKDVLTKHLRIHTNQMPFACDICLRTFRRKAHLSDHMNTHSGRRPYKCLTCEKGFAHVLHLSNHVKIHVEK